MSSRVEAELYFKDCLSSINHPLHSPIEFDQAGWKRFKCPFSKHSKSSAAYKAFSDGTPTLIFECHRCQLPKTFIFKCQIKENNAHKAISEDYKVKEHAERQLAYKAMNNEFDHAKPCSSHSYFEHKRVDIKTEFGYRVNGNTLLCPIYDANKNLIDVQKIYYDSITNKYKKIFFKGLSPKGGFHILGDISKSNQIFFAEGAATAITIHQATNKPCVCVFGKHFDNIAKILAEIYPQKKFVYCADETGEQELNSSLDNANKAIAIVGGRVTLPNFSEMPESLCPEIVRSDFNDLFALLVSQGYSRQEANEIVCSQLAAASIEHNSIFQEILKQLSVIDFRLIADLSDDEKLSSRHLQIICIDKILEVATSNSWGMCRNHDFIYLYNGELWKLISHDELKSFLGIAAEALGVDRYKARHFIFRENLYKQFMAQAYLPKPDNSAEQIKINLQNGSFTINPNGISLDPFNHLDFLTYQLPFDYDPDAKAPMFNKYLDHVLPDSQSQNILGEFIGSIFIQPSTLKLEKALILYGSGANGKSVLYEIVRNLLGKENTSEYSLQSLTNENGYYRAMIGNKLVNYASEINGKLETSIFKQLVSGEPVEARLPYGHPFILDRYAKLIFNCNELPKDVEHSEAFFRRFMIMPFSIKIPEHEQDKELAKKIVQNELSGIFNWVLCGLNRLLTQKCFSTCDATIQAVKKYELDSDSIQLFLHEYGYTSSATEYITVKKLYVEYRSFCAEDGFPAISKLKFKRRLEKLNYTFQRKNIGEVIYVVRQNKLLFS